MTAYAITDNAVAVPAGSKAYLAQAILDFSTTNLAAADTIDVIKVPANTLVLCAGIEVITAGSNAGTIDMGDATAPDTWVTDIAQDATGQETGSAAKYYSAADTLDLLGVTADMDGKIRVFAVMVPAGPVDPAAAAFA
jgi:hypothetical protein